MVCYRYTPELNRHCTHLIAAAGVSAVAGLRHPSRASESPSAVAVSRKLKLAQINRLKWPTRIVSLAWFHDCCRNNRRAPEVEYAFLRGGEYSTGAIGPPSTTPNQPAAEQGTCLSRFSGTARAALADVESNQLPRAHLAGSLRPLQSSAPTLKVRSQSTACDCHMVIYSHA